MKAEVEKPESERGHYLQLYDQPEEKSVDWAHQPDLMQRVKSMKERAKQQ